MKCVICRQGETKDGFGTVTMERGQTTLVVKKVPAQVCDNCGETYFDQETTQRLLDTAKAAERAGVQVDVREYIAA